MNMGEWIRTHFVKTPTKSEVEEDAPFPISQEQSTQLLKALGERFKEHEEERRRSLQITAGFFEKLATLNAGSIAVGSSILLAIEFKTDPHSDFKSVVHEILVVVILLWISLMLSLFHNALAAYIAHVDSEYSETKFTWALFEETIMVVRDGELGLDGEVYNQVERMMRKQWAPKQERLVHIKSVLLPSVRYLGYAAIGIFAIAYTLVLVFLIKLW